MPTYIQCLAYSTWKFHTCTGTYFHMLSLNSYYLCNGVHQEKNKRVYLGCKINISFPYYCSSVQQLGFNLYWRAGEAYPLKHSIFPLYNLLGFLQTIFLTGWVKNTRTHNVCLLWVPWHPVNWYCGSSGWSLQRNKEARIAFVNLVLTGRNNELTFWVDVKTTCTCKVYTYIYYSSDINIFVVNRLQSTGLEMCFYTYHTTSEWIWESINVNYGTSPPYSLLGIFSQNTFLE